MSVKLGIDDVSFRLGNKVVSAYLGAVEVYTPDPFATLVSTKSTGNVSGSAKSDTGYIKVEWWDSTTNVYGTGVAGNSINWSKAAGGAGSKTLLIYPSDASGNLSGALTELLCNSNSLTSLDVSGLTALNDLNCSGNSLTSLDVSGLTALNDLNCNINSLTSLDVSGLTALNDLNCNDNSLTSLRAVGCSFAGVAQLSSNSLSAPGLNQFYADLAQTVSGNIVVAGNPGTTGDDPTIATAKGYTVFGT
jgi:hypothetical protein